MSKDSRTANFVPVFHDVAASTSSARHPLRRSISRLIQAGILLALAVIADFWAAQSTLTEGATPAWTVATGHAHGVKAIAFSPDGRRLATGKEDGCIVLWVLGDGVERELSCERFGRVIDLAFSSDGTTLASAHDNCDVVLWDTNTGQERTTLKGHTGVVMDLDFFSDGATLVTASDDRSIRLWDVASGSNKAVWTDLSGAVRTVIVSPDGRAIASVNTNGLVKLWDVSTGECRHSFKPTNPGYAGKNLAFSHDGSTLAFAGVCLEVKLWDVATGLEQGVLCRDSHTIRKIALPSNQPRVVILRYDGTVQITDLAASAERKIALGNFPALCSAFSPDAAWLALGDLDGTVRVWNLNPFVSKAFESFSPNP